MKGKGWERLKVGDIAAPGRNSIVGGPFGSDLVSKDYVPNGIPVIRGANMGNGRWVSGEFVYVSKAKAESLAANCAKPGDLIFTQRGTIGQIALVPQNGPSRYLLSQSQMKLSSDAKKADALFLYYNFSGSQQQKYIQQNAIRTGVPHTNLGILRDTPLLLPPLSQQRAIADIVGALDSKIELNNQINAELEAMAKLLYDYWFVQFDFPMTAAQAASLGRPALEGKPYKTSGGKMVHSPTLNRKIPEGWSADTLDKLGQVVGGTTPSKENDAYYCEAGIPWITPKDLSNNKGRKFIDRGEIDVTEAGQKRGSLKLMPAGTVLLSSRAPIGYTAIACNPLTTNQGFKSFVPSKGYGSDFIFRTLNHFMKLIEQNASGSTFREISGGTLKAIKIPMPHPSLAKLYCDKVKSMSAQQQNLEKQNQELTQLRDWLLPMLMNGQVTVTQDQ